MKRNRQEAIIEIINKYEVSTQTEITDLLKREGYNVTQATVSRDIKDLKLVKSLGKGGKQRYRISSEKNSVSHMRAMRIFKEGATSVDYAGNIVIIKTLVGMANAVCAGIDAMGDGSILGTVAGDDTILCVVRGEEAAKKLTEELKNS